MSLSSIRAVAAAALCLFVVGCHQSSSSSAAQATEAGHREDAVFVNGDFEDGGLSGWTVSTYRNLGITYPPSTRADLMLQSGGTVKTKVINGAPETVVPAGLTAANSLRVPKYGRNAAVVNELGSGYNANSLLQQFTVTSADVDPSDNKVHVRFALAPVLQSGGHPPNQQPYFWVTLRNITRATTLYADFNFAEQSGVPWQLTGSIYFTDWQSFDIAPGNVALTVGDTIELEVIAAGCSQSGHWGEVYVDGFGAFLPGLQVSASAAQSVNAGSNLTYTLNYQNRGTGASANTIVTFNLPANVLYQSFSAPGATCTAPALNATTGAVVCNVGAVNPNQTGSFTVTVQVAAAATGKISAGNYSIKADSVTPLIGPLVETNITTGVQYADLSATITDGVAAVGWGAPYSFSFTVVNAGPTTATAASVVWSVPAQLTSATWSCAAAAGSTCAAVAGSGSINSTATLPSGGSVTYTVNANVVTGSGTGSMSNLVTVSAPSGLTDNATGNNQAIDTNAIGTLRTISFAKTGAGTGRVVTSPAAVDCAAACTTASTSFIDGTSVSVTATASTGNVFSGFTGACTGTANPCTFTVSGDATLTTSFTLPPRTITASAGTGGTISPTGAVSVVSGGSQTFTITPATGKAITAVTVDGTSVGAVSSYTFSNVTVDHTIAATFSSITYAIAASAGAHGTISPSGTQTVSYGATQSFSISPAALYRVADVLVDGVSVGQVTSYVFTNVTAPHTIAVSFTLIDVPPSLITTAGTTQWTEEDAAVVVDPTLSLTDPDGPNLAAARVSISTGFVPTEDRLLFTAQNGISGSFDTASGVLTLTGSATVAQYEAALRSVRYTNAITGTPDTRARIVTFSAGSTLANSDNGHFYEFVTATGIAWTAAQNAASLRSLYGLQGYLVTITDANENAFVTTRLAGQGWMGATDANVENTWRWVTGPEGLENGGLGRNFFLQSSNYLTACSTGARGSPVGSFYNAWAVCEPNDYGSTGEDYAHFYVDGSWNDYPGTGAAVAGYVVEYGGMPQDSVVQLSGTRGLQINALPTFGILATAGANGTIAPAGLQTVKQGHAQSFTIAAAANYHVADVTVDGASVGPVASYTFTNVSGGHLIDATFAVDAFDITVNAATNGSVTCQTPVTYGQSSTCTIVPDVGYELSSLTDNALEVTALVVNDTYTAVLVTGDHAIAAVFKLSRGGSCGAASDCGTGLCVDGVCCNTSCTGQCESCAQAGSVGTCAPVTGAPVGRAACASDGSLCGGTCDGSITASCVYPPAATDCRGASCSVGVETHAATCDGAGSCPAITTTNCNTFTCGATACNTTCAADSQCADGFYCSANACVPKTTSGGTCARDGECGSGFCTDGLCCNSACNGQCEACDVTGHEGVCSPASGAPHGTVRVACDSDGSSCGGSCDGTTRANCTYPDATAQCRAPSCAAGDATLAASCDGQGNCPTVQHQLCNPYVCGADQCLGNCVTDAECDAGNWCSAGVCTLKAMPGTSCGGDNQCGSGFCTDGLCCNVACNGQCEACDTTETPGTCAMVTGAPHAGRAECQTDGTSCGGTCDGTRADACAYPGAGSQCRAPACAAGVATLAAACDGHGACPGEQTQACSPFVCGATACAGDCLTDTNCATGHYCSAGVCVEKKVNAGACAANNQCASGSCVDGVCCNVACGGQCQACDVPGTVGTCTAVAGAPHGSRDACDADGSLCGGQCDGTQTAACSYPTVECRGASCSQHTATLSASCNHGVCPNVQQHSCGQYACEGDICHGDCTTDANCTAGNYCAGGMCAPLKMNAGSCSADNQCGSGHCTDGVCCNQACGGQCEACDSAGHVGSCTAVSGATHGARPSCASDDSSCGGSCDGTDRTACSYPASTVSCVTASCTSGVETHAASCSGTGQCSQASTAMCGAFGCGDTACKTSCSTDADCGADSFCTSGVCQANGNRALWKVQGGVGSGCSTSGSGAMTWLLALVAAAMLGRSASRRRTAARVSKALVIGAAVVLGASTAAAQTSTDTSRTFLLERFQPQAGAGDILGVQSARISPHLKPRALVTVSYADVPLRAVTEGADGTQRQLALNQTTVNIAAAIGFFNRVELGIALPISFTESAGAAAVDTSLANPVAKASIADLQIRPKVRLFEAGAFGFAAALPFTLPTGARDAYVGYSGVTATPSLIGQWEGPRRSAVIVNLGIAIRSPQQLLNLTVGSAFAYSLGAKVDLWPKQNVALLGNIGGEIGFAGVTAVQSPLEAIAAIRWIPVGALAFTLGAGPGITRGYGTPRFRVLASIGWVPGDDVEDAPRPMLAPLPRAPELPAMVIGDDVAVAMVGEEFGPISVLDNDHGAVNETLQVTELRQPTHGRAWLEDGHVRYLPNPGYVGRDDIGYRVSGGEGRVANGTVNVEVQGRPEPEVVAAVVPEPAPQVVEARRVFRQLSKVYFATNRAEVLPRSLESLDEVAKVMAETPSITKLRIEAHTDGQGAAEKNLALSEARAQWVRAYLLQKGVSADRVEAHGFGLERPIESNQTADGRSANRRVEFVVVE